MYFWKCCLRGSSGAVLVRLALFDWISILAQRKALLEYVLLMSDNTGRHVELSSFTVGIVLAFMHKIIRHIFLNG